VGVRIEEDEVKVEFGSKVEFGRMGVSHLGLYSH
jgi:hypothetical protein